MLHELFTGLDWQSATYVVTAFRPASAAAPLLTCTCALQSHCKAHTHIVLSTKTQVLLHRVVVCLILCSIQRTRNEMCGLQKPPERKSWESAVVISPGFAGDSYLSDQIALFQTPSTRMHLLTSLWRLYIHSGPIMNAFHLTIKLTQQDLYNTLSNRINCKLRECAWHYVPKQPCAVVASASCSSRFECCVPRQTGARMQHYPSARTIQNYRIIHYFIYLSGG